MTVGRDNIGVGEQSIILPGIVSSFKPFGRHSLHGLQMFEWYGPHHDPSCLFFAGHCPCPAHVMF